MRRTREALGHEGDTHMGSAHEPALSFSPARLWKTTSGVPQPCRSLAPADRARPLRTVEGALGSIRFRRAIAQVYLRRNQDDVFDGLPPRLETEGMGAASRQGRHRLPRCRLPGQLHGDAPRGLRGQGTRKNSAKLRRLLDITDEATQDGRKVVVFSFFRDVLTSVAAALGETAIGPITGDVPPAKRQGLIDEFAARGVLHRSL